VLNKGTNMMVTVTSTGLSETVYTLQTSTIYCEEINFQLAFERVKHQRCKAFKAQFESSK